MKLTKAELKEPISVTIGRLKASIDAGKKERSIALLEKVSNEITELGIKYPDDLIYKYENND